MALRDTDRAGTQRETHGVRLGFGLLSCLELRARSVKAIVPIGRRRQRVNRGRRGEGPHLEKRCDDPDKSSLDRLLLRLNSPPLLCCCGTGSGWTGGGGAVFLCLLKRPPPPCERDVEWVAVVAAGGGATFSSALCEVKSPMLPRIRALREVETRKRRQAEEQGEGKRGGEEEEQLALGTAMTVCAS